jgi:hypothetical protein
MTKQRQAPTVEAPQEAPSGPSPGGAAGVVDQDRLDRLDQLAEKATSQYGGQEEPKVTRELVNQPKDPETGRFLPKDPEAKPAAEKTEPEPVAEAAPVEEQAPEPTSEPAPVIKHKIKVNGREQELTTEEMIARVQKIEAADDYLKQAAQLYKTAKEPAPEPKAPASVEEDDAALARAIQTGTEQEAIAAIQKMRARPSASTDDVLRIVNTQLAITEANRKFETEYADIVQDPYLRSMVQMELQQRIQRQDPRSYQENLFEIGENLKQWKASLVPVSAQVQQKEARKATVTVIPTAAARAAGKTEEKPESHAETVAEMAKQRNAR